MIDFSGLDEPYRRRAFLLDPENRPLVLGEPMPPQPGGIRWRLLGWVVVLLVGAGLIFWLQNTVTTDNQLAQTGAETWGEVIDRREFDDGEAITYWIWLAYTIDDVAYERDFLVGKVMYEQSDNGEPVRVTYLPDNPEVVSVQPANITPVLEPGILLALWAILVIALLFNSIRAFIRRPRPLRRGQLIAAQKVRAWASHSPNLAYLLHIEYEFESPKTGAVIIDTASATREDLRLRPEVRPLHTAEVLPGEVNLIVIYRNERRYELL